MAVLKVNISLADKCKIFGHIADLINKCRSSALNALDFSIFMQLATALFAKGMTTRDKKFWNMLDLVIFELASCTIHLKFNR